MTDSWWLKLKRAQQHMVDIKREADRYASLHPYELTRIRQPDHKNDIRHRVRITQQPDLAFALMFGDFIHNLRSALDHIVVASVPHLYQSNAGFPITFKDLFTKRGDGQFVIHDDEARENFERSIRGIDPRARAFIIRSQPYHLGREAYRSMLGIISRLDNLDKHRALMTFGGGVKNLFADVTIRDQVGRLQHHSLAQNEFAQDNTIIGWGLPDDWRQPGFPRPSEVNMQYNGTAVVHIKIVGVDGKQRTFNFPLSLTMVRALKEVRRTLKLMEPFVLR